MKRLVKCFLRKENLKSILFTGVQSSRNCHSSIRVSIAVSGWFLIPYWTVADADDINDELERWPM